MADPPHGAMFPRPLGRLFRVGALLGCVILLADLAVLVLGVVRLNACMIGFGLLGGFISFCYIERLWTWGGRITRGEPIHDEADD